MTAMETGETRDACATASPQTRRMGRRLVALLKQELVLQHRLLGVAAQTREAIVERNVVVLAALQERHKALMDEAEQRAAERMDTSRDIARVAGLPPANLTLSQVMDCCPPDILLTISAIRAMLVETATEVHKAHGLNRELLENELDYIGSSLEVLARAAAPRRDYRTPLGRLPAPAIILDKAA